MAKNVHKVPKLQWKKWNKDEQAMFNRLWDYLTPDLLPEGVPMTTKQFNVLRWNTCWTASSMLREWRAS